MKNKPVLFLISLALFSVLTTPLITSNRTSAQEQLPPQSNKYTDSQGRFSFSYPSDWELDVPENRFTKTSEVAVSAPENITGWASVEVRIVEGTETSMDLFGLKDFVDITVSRLSNQIPDFRLLEDVDCEKYEIDGREACSVQYVRGIGSSFGSDQFSSDGESDPLASLLGRHAI